MANAGRGENSDPHSSLWLVDDARRCNARVPIDHTADAPMERERAWPAIAAVTFGHQRTFIEDESETLAE